MDRISIAVAALGNRTESAADHRHDDHRHRHGPRRSRCSRSPRQPVDFGNSQKLTIAGPPGFTAPDLSTASITIVSKPGLAGPAKHHRHTDHARPDPGRDRVHALSFVDPSIAPAVGLTYPAMPGRYSVQVTLPGFVTANVDLLCPLGDPGATSRPCARS